MMAREVRMMGMGVLPIGGWPVCNLEVQNTETERRNTATEVAAEAAKMSEK